MVETDRDAGVWFQGVAVTDDASLCIGDDAVTTLEDGLRVEVGQGSAEPGEISAVGIDRLTGRGFQTKGQGVQAAGNALGLRPGNHQALPEAGECLPAPVTSPGERTRQAVRQVLKLLALSVDLFGGVQEPVRKEVDGLLATVQLELPALEEAAAQGGQGVELSGAHGRGKFGCCRRRRRPAVSRSGPPA